MARRLLVSAMVVAAVLSRLPSSADEGPQVVTVIIPRYPAVARQARVSGSTSVVLEVDAGGVPRQVTPQGPRIPLLTEACVRALTEWRFSPASSKTTRRAAVTCTFHLLSRNAPEPRFAAKLTMPGLLEITEQEPTIEAVSERTSVHESRARRGTRGCCRRWVTGALVDDLAGGSTCWE